MTHKSRYLPAPAVVTALAALTACTDRPPATAPGRPESAASPPAAELQAQSEALAQPGFAASLKAQLDASPFREHKLHFQRFLTAAGGRARDEVAQHAGVAA